MVIGLCHSVNAKKPSLTFSVVGIKPRTYQSESVSLSISSKSTEPALVSGISGIFHSLISIRAPSPSLTLRASPIGIACIATAAVTAVSMFLAPLIGSCESYNTLAERKPVNFIFVLAFLAGVTSSPTSQPIGERLSYVDFEAPRLVVIAVSSTEKSTSTPPLPHSAVSGPKQPARTIVKMRSSASLALRMISLKRI